MQIIQTLCDICFKNDKQTNSTGTNRIEVNARAIEIDLCSECKTQAETVFAPYYEMGRRPDKILIKTLPKAMTEKNFPCTVSGCTKAFAQSQGLAMHKTRVHRLPGNRDPEVEQHILREVEGETAIDRKRRRDRERYHAVRAKNKKDSHE